MREEPACLVLFCLFRSQPASLPVFMPVFLDDATHAKFFCPARHARLPSLLALFASARAPAPILIVSVRKAQRARRLPQRRHLFVCRRAETGVMFAMPPTDAMRAAVEE